MAMTTLRRSNLRGPTEAGFSLVELLIVLAVVGIVSGMAVVQVQATMTMARADSVASQVASILRFGRDAAVSQRRTVDVTFVAPNQIVLTRNDRPVGTTQIATLYLENGGRFMFQLNDGVPDTPDGFGRASAIDFDGAAVIRFQPDGSLTDGAAVPINGTVFIALQGQPLSQRAITVTGTTARSQPYRWTGARWETQ
jgi:prepilin-type N-terminal cleavage/methylation domain-containing protein